MIRDLLGLSKEPLETEISEAAERFKKEKEDEIDSTQKKANAIRSDVIEELDSLEESLNELKDFEDEKDRQVINDVVDNIITDRIEMIDEFTSSEDPEELYSEIDEFINDFQSLTQKEAAVLEEAYLQKKISRTIGGLENQREQLSEFIETEYKTVTNYEELKQLLNRRESLRNEIESLEEEIEKLEVEHLTAEVEDIEQKLSDLKNSSKWSDYEYIKSEVDQKTSERKNLISDIKTSLNKMERGLKKLIYQSKNGDASVEEVSVLEKLRDKKIDNILANPEKTVEALEEAKKSLPEDLLNDKQEKKFLESISEVEDLPQKSERIDSLESEAEELEQQIEDHSVIQERDKLESKRRTRQKQLSQERDDRDSLEKKVQDTRSEVEEIENRIRKIMKESFNRNVKIN